MANGFQHKSVGTAITQAEYEQTDTGHQFESQATGDILYASSSTVLRRLAIGSTGEVLEVAGGVPTWAAATADPSKQFFVPATATVSGASGSNDGWAVISLTGVNHHAYITFNVPSDYSSITTAIVAVIPTAAQSAANWDLKADYAAIGQADTTHEETNTGSTYNVTDQQLFSVDVSGILGSLAANDYVGIRLSQKTSGHNVDVLGVYFKYA
jgi:hypothetical protein